jgi:hypothetical protein
MKKCVTLAILGISLAAALPAQARNIKYMLPIAAAVESSDAKQRLDSSVKLFFGPQAHPNVLQKLGSSESPGKAKIVERADIPACNAALVDALLQLQKHAKSAGANAIVNIVSYYGPSALVSSSTEFECHAGSMSVGLGLKGDFVKITDK